MLLVYVRLVVRHERDGRLEVLVGVQLEVFGTVALEQLVDVDVEQLRRLIAAAATVFARQPVLAQTLMLEKK